MSIKKFFNILILALWQHLAAAFGKVLSKQQCKQNSLRQPCHNPNQHLIRFAAKLVILVSTLASPPMALAENHSHDAIRSAALNFAVLQLGHQDIELGSIDERLQFAKCQQPLLLSFPFNSHRTVKIRCPETGITNTPTWSLFVAITAKPERQAWMLLENISAGRSIAPHQVKLALYKGSASSLLLEGDSPVGQQLKRSLPAQHWLRTKDLADTLDLWRVVRDIASGELLHKDDLTLVRLPKAQQPANAISAFKQIDGQLAKRFIKAGKVLTSADIETRVQTVVATRSLPIGRTLIAEDLQLQWLPEHKSQTAIYTDQKSLVGMVTATYIAKGKAITANAVQPAFLVTKGEQVVLFVNAGKLHISNYAKALESGLLGDIIQVEIPSTGAVKSGRIDSLGQVELIP